MPISRLSLTLCLGILFGFFPPSAKGEVCFKHACLVVKTCTVHNGYVDHQEAKIYFLPPPSPPAGHPVILRGTASLTLPCEKEEAIKRAVLNALASYTPPAQTARVATATVVRHNPSTIAEASRVTTMTFFSPPVILAYHLEGYTLHVALKTFLLPSPPSLIYPQPSPLPSSPLPPVMGGLLSDLTHRLFQLVPF